MAVMEGGEPVVLENSEGRRITPSVVAFTKTGERLVGDAAKRQAITNSKNTVYSIKRFMGRKFSEVEEEKKRVPYKVVSGSNGDACVEVEIEGKAKQYTPAEVSAMILGKLKADAEMRLDHRAQSDPLEAEQPPGQFGVEEPLRAHADLGEARQVLGRGVQDPLVLGQHLGHGL